MDRTKGAALRCLAFAFTGVLAASLPASRAWADPPPAAAAPASLVIVADAPQSRQAVAGLGGRLPEPWRLGDDAAIRRALAAAGQRTTAGVALGDATSRAALARKARAAAGEAGAQGVLFVRATPKRGVRLVTLLLVAPGEADPVLDTTVEAPMSDDGAALMAVLAPALARVAPRPSSSSPASSAPSPASPTATAPPPPGADGAAPPDPSAPVQLGGVDRAILVFSAGGGIGARVFRYNDGLTPSLRSYDLPVSPSIALAAEVYPFARLSVPVLRGLGVFGAVQHAPGISSQTSKGAMVTTTWLRLEGGLRIRLAFGDDARFLLGVHGGVIEERFGFKGDPTLVPFLPDVDYVFWRVGADGRLRVGPVALLAGASYLPAIAGGALADRFRETSFAAVELGGGLAVPVARIFEMRASAVYTRVFYSFNPVPGDVYVAGGALDHLVRAQVFATLLL